MRTIEQANIIKLKFVHVKSDSKYSINMIQKIPEHIKRCWLTKNKSLINNKDILTNNDKKVKSCLDRLRGIAEEHVVSWSKLRLREGLKRDGLTPMELGAGSVSTTMGI